MGCFVVANVYLLVVLTSTPADQSCALSKEVEMRLDLRSWRRVLTSHALERQMGYRCKNSERANYGRSFKQ